MRQYLITKEVSYNAIFYSAFKALIVFDMLLQSPKTLDQISDFLTKLPYIKSTISKDSLRVYINTFRNAGCNVKKELTKAKRREYAYYIPENPFKLTVSELQAKKLFEIYEFIMYNLPFEELLNVDLLFRKINDNSKDEIFYNLYEKHSLLKDFDTELLMELEQCCKENALVTVLYNSPRSGFKEIPIIAYKMKVQNYKLYLEGFGMEYKTEGIFLMDRIIKITNIIPGEEVEMPQENFFDIIFELYDPTAELTECEEVISEKGEIRTVRHRTSNKVLTTHRFLQLSNSCKILEPAEFKNEFIATLKSAKEGYLYGT